MPGWGQTNRQEVVLNKSSDCPDKCRAEGVVDFDHLFHYGPITDDYGNDVWLPMDDYLRELLEVVELTH